MARTKMRAGSNIARPPDWSRLTPVDAPIDELIGRDRHARRHPATQIRDLARSIETFGFNTPVVIDEDNRLLAGHARVAAARRLGWRSVPAVRVSDLTEAEKVAYTLADNRLAEQARWDEAMLAETFRILDDLELDFDLDVTGFSTSDIDRLLGFEIVDDADRQDACPDLDDGPLVARAGDVWELGRHRLVCGDALDDASFATLMSGERARMILTDPPYNVSARHIGRTAASRHGNFVAAAGELDDPGFVRFLETMFTAARRVSLDGALAFVFMDWRHVWHALDAGRRVFDDLKNICVWRKTNGGMGSLYRSQHELVLVFKIGKAAHVNTIELGRHGRNRTNVWDFAGANGFDGAIEDAGRAATLETHPTVKPVRLLAEAILDVSRRDDIVLDPFLGSGSTLIACERVGRQCRGLELDPRYVDATLRRWRAYTGVEPIHAETGLGYEARREEVTKARPCGDAVGLAR